MGQTPFNVNAKAAIYSKWLRGQMRAHGLSNRALGKLISPENAETGRRIVMRHLAGEHFPNAQSRAVYLEVFGLEGDPFSDEEAEEDQALYRDLRDARALLARIEKAVRT